MRIIRFIDIEGNESYGVLSIDGKVRKLHGNLFGEFTIDKDYVKIAKLLAPIVPCNIFCIGLNYADHAIETGATAPAYPIMFMKPTSALCHPNDPISIPACCTHGLEVDFEAELVVIIGTTARNVSESQALQHVYGYTIANDISARRWQKYDGGGQWVRGKSFDSFCPLGPLLITADEISNPQHLRIASILNGVVMQNSNTANMLFSIARLISLLSQDTTLLPGTAILTGTPAGVGFTRNPPVFLQAGDKIVIEIENIGTLENTVI